MEIQQFQSPDEEIIKPSGMHDFLHLSEQEMSSLREHLANFDGTMRIFVHPSYWIYRKDLTGTDKQREVDRKEAYTIMHFLAKVLGTDRDKCPPVLVMDEKVPGDDIDEQLKGLYEFIISRSGNEVYLARTAQQNPVPVFDDFPEGVDEREYLEENNVKLWHRFLNILSEAGVKKVIVSGSDFTINPVSIESMTQNEIDACAPFIMQRLGRPNNSPLYIAKDCAGGVATILSNRFQVELSNFAHPHSRGDQRRFESGKENWDSYKIAIGEENIDDQGPKSTDGSV